MPRRPRSDEPGLWHHVMNRGLAKRTVFENALDMRMFLALIARAVRAGSIELHAYSLMTTHYHLLVRSIDGNLGETMRRVQNLYVRWFNRSRRRDGPLFRGRFRSRPVETVAYRRAVVSYIDFNPIEARIVDRPENYPHGSAHHYARQAGPKWLYRSWIEGEVQECSGLGHYRPESYPDVFGRAASEPGRALVARRLARGASRIDPLDELLEAAPVAVLDWMNRKARLADGTQTGIAVCDAGALQSTIQQRRSVRPWILLARGQAFDAWNQIETGLLRDLCGLTLREISLSTGRAESTVARLCERHRHRLAEDSEYADRVSNIASASLRKGAAIGAAASPDNCAVSDEGESGSDHLVE